MKSYFRRRMLERVFIYGTGLAVLGWMTLVGPWNHKATVLSQLLRGRPTAPTVVLVVLDTLRADHTSLCGYERPTTPTLTRLKAEGWSATCRAYAPGSWTLPSHASFFTGLSVPEHGVRHVDPVFQALGDDEPVVAQIMRDRGYQTLAVVGNPIMVPETGLLRGFDHAYTVAERDFDVPIHLANALRWHTESARPLFLFVNIFDAHSPWAGIPEGQEWAPARNRIDWEFTKDSWTYRYEKKEMPASEAAPIREHVVDVYDWAVRQADQRLDDTLEILGDHGWLDAGYRIVVVSDHGELLMEHDAVYHARYLYEPISRVPLLFKDTERSQPLVFPEPVSATAVYDLLLTGELPASPHPVVAHSYKDWNLMAWLDEEDAPDRVAAWQGFSKLISSGSQVVRYNLQSDPDEEHGVVEAGTDDNRNHAPGSLEFLLQGAVIAGKHPRTTTPAEVQGPLRQRLEALGYLGKSSDEPQ